MRRLFVLIAALAILLTVLVPPASAGRRWTEAPATTIAADAPAPRHGNQSCLDGDLRGDLFSGTDDSSQNYSRTAAGAYLTANFDVCGDDDSGVSVWVGLQPRTTFFGGEVVQAGILACKPKGGISLPNICNDYPGQLRRFGGAGGCTNDVLWDMGPATAGTSYNVRVEHDGDGFRFYNGGSVSFIGRNDQRVWCFYAVHLKSMFITEKWDRGDSTGTYATRSTFTSMGAQNVSNPNVWYSINKQYGNCSWIMPTAPHTSSCTMGGNTMYAWD